MIISEKQIMQLIEATIAYKDTLKVLVRDNPAMQYSKDAIEEIDYLLGEIVKQQSEELKVIE